MPRNEFKNINQQLQFYNTPTATVDKMLSCLDNKDLKGLDILEPSAGQGGILFKLMEKYPDNNYYYCEFLDFNKNIIEEQKKNCSFICNDFLTIEEHTNKKFDLICANPPFSKNQDIKHIKKMYDILKDDGTIITICSNSWRNKKQKECDEFKELLNKNEVEIIELNNDGFKDIGLSVATCILIIKKTEYKGEYTKRDYTWELEFEKAEPPCLEDFMKAIFDYWMYEQWEAYEQFKYDLKNYGCNLRADELYELSKQEKYKSIFGIPSDNNKLEEARQKKYSFNDMLYHDIMLDVDLSGFKDNKKTKQ